MTVLGISVDFQLVDSYEFLLLPELKYTSICKFVGCWFKCLKKLAALDKIFHY